MKKKPIVSLAPMMQYTDRNFRYFIRTMSKDTTLYTEMLTPQAILYSNSSKREQMLAFHPKEHPIILQLGSNNPELLKQVSPIIEEYKYDGINLNIGCPSEKVQHGNFGACLMEKPELVAQCIQAIQQKTPLPISVKHRIGVQYSKNSEELENQIEKLKKFVYIIKQAGCKHIIVHARVAILGGLSPKENRSVPPIHYQPVYDLKREFPDISVEINGEITTVQQVQKHLSQVDGAMLGRISYQNPYIYSTIDQDIFKNIGTPITREQIIHEMIEYTNEHLLKYPKTSKSFYIFHHMVNLFYQQKNAKQFRTTLIEESHKNPDSAKALKKAYQKTLV